jgi:hypothetical protein
MCSGIPFVGMIIIATFNARTSILTVAIHIHIYLYLYICIYIYTYTGWAMIPIAATLRGTARNLKVSMYGGTPFAVVNIQVISVAFYYL